MITEERISTFINSFDTGNTPFLNELEQYARETNVPVIRPQMQSFLKLLLSMKQPERILEVGTAIGFSALFMSEYGRPDCQITTIENYEKTEILKTLQEPYDMIFMDAAKGQYIHFLPDVMRLLKKGGILVSDNVLQDGDVMESRYAVTRRNRTIHSRMREYLYELKHNDQLVTDILPVGDGVTVSAKL